jgi:hypothetical protein
MLSPRGKLKYAFLKKINILTVEKKKVKFKRYFTHLTVQCAEIKYSDILATIFGEKKRTGITKIVWTITVQVLIAL